MRMNYILSMRVVLYNIEPSRKCKFLSPELILIFLSAALGYTSTSVAVVLVTAC